MEKRNKIRDKLAKKSKEKSRSSSTPDTTVHPWRVCPYGQHQVIEHPRHNPPSKTHPEGSVSTIHWYCAHNPSGKDQLYPDEIQEISSQHFSNLKNMPCPLSLGFTNGGTYDDLIAGWTKYWNDVLKPAEPLDPNLVKALIATESRFIPNLLANKKNQNSARGLMQILNGTREVLGDEEGEIKDHYLVASRAELNDPSVNICGGVRWLFHKRDLISKKLKRQVSWVETVSHYKGTSKAATKKRAEELMNRFKKRYEELTKCEKK